MTSNFVLFASVVTLWHRVTVGESTTFTGLGSGGFDFKLSCVRLLLFLREGGVSTGS